MVSRPRPHIAKRAWLRGRRTARSLSPFKGQKGQDRWVILSVLRLKRRGYFVDLAAADGVIGSNTYALEKLFGWSGICVEPNPGYLTKLRAKRTCIVDESVVSDRHERVAFRIDNGHLGGIVADDTDNSPRVRADELASATTITRNTVTLGEILDRHNAPEIIDYLSLDVEGSEERVIRSLDFNERRFRCLTIERPTQLVNEILFRNGYRFVRNVDFDTYYVAEDLVPAGRIKFQPFEQVPPKEW